MRPWGQWPKFHWWLHLTTWTEWNLILKFHNLIINSTIINKSTIINSWEWYLQLLARRRSMLRSHCNQTNGILRLQLWNWLELFTLKWCTREDGLLGHCKAKIWMGNPRLDSLLWDGRWMNWFVLRLRKEDSCWLLPKTTEYFEYQRGLLRWKIWTFTQLSCRCLFMSCRSYGRLSIASLWKRSHQEILLMEYRLS